MKFDKYMELIRENLEPDGMGGFIVGESETLGLISAFVTPVNAETLLKEHGIVTTRGMKVFTKEILPDGEFQIEYAGNRFEVLQISDYEKIRVLLIQEIEVDESI